MKLALTGELELLGRQSEGAERVTGGRSGRWGSRRPEVYVDCPSRYRALITEMRDKQLEPPQHCSAADVRAGWGPSTLSIKLRLEMLLLPASACKSLGDSVGAPARL